MGMTIFLVGLALFLGAHSVSIFARGWRDAQVAAGGEGRWKGQYTLASLAGFALLVWGYGMAQPTAPVLYVTPFWMAHPVALLMLFAMLSLGVSQVPAGRLKPLLKHPMLVAVKIWAFAHLLINGDLASVLLFGAFLAWAVLDRISLKRRNAPIPAPGPATNDAIGLGLGLLLYGLFVWKLHEWLIGVAILPYFGA